MPGTMFLISEVCWLLPPIAGSAAANEGPLTKNAVASFRWIVHWWPPAHHEVVLELCYHSATTNPAAESGNWAPQYLWSPNSPKTPDRLASSTQVNIFGFFCLAL